MNIVEDFICAQSHYLGDSHVKIGRTHFVSSQIPKEKFTHLDRQTVINIQYNSIRNAFALNDTPTQFEAFNHAVGGSGNEWLEITQLNSSTLLAFLCFSGVTKSNPITIQGFKPFTHAFFEVKSPLKPSGRSHPVSNMDIVLTNSSQVLFLESKFTEYLTTTFAYKVKPYYLKAYDNVLGEIIQVGDVIFNRTSCSWESPKCRQYLEGIKQMVCHYLGIKNCIEQTAVRIPSWNVNIADSASECLAAKSEFFLGEILFAFSCDEFKNYKRLHSQLVPRLKPIRINDKRFSVVKELFTYQSIFSGTNAKLLTKPIREFYAL